MKKPDLALPDEYRQLAFELDIGEPVEGGADEARRISEAARLAFEARFGQVGWYDDYLKLRAEGWPWRQAAYIAWAACPKSKREPRTMDELAREYLGLTSDRAISTWRRKNPLIDEMVAMLQAAPLWEYRAEIYRALVAVAIKPEYKGHNDRKLALELLGDYVPASKLVAEMTKRVKGDLSEMSDEELAALARALNEEAEDDDAEA